VIEAIGWDEKTFDGFHGYDIDCTFRAHLAGHKLAVANDIVLLHASGGNYNNDWLRYVGRVVQKHREAIQEFVPRQFSHCYVDLPSKSHVGELMPAYWTED